MAGNTWEKRQREKQKRERKEAKRVRRDEKREAPVTTEGPSSEELLVQFAALTREHKEGQIDDATFHVRRNEIWVAMGLPADGA